ncbi:hypothetical protein HZU38_05560 [Mycolicibacterium vanbaalenii]|nr:hypothetical protein HZU38_05560 [Mycolicibacterium vanbaalenii]
MSVRGFASCDGVADRRYECPVCRRELKQSVHGNIPSHLDSIRSDVCPASGEPYRIMLECQPEFVGVVA